jgi:hypothetical protein
MLNVLKVENSTTGINQIHANDAINKTEAMNLLHCGKDTLKRLEDAGAIEFYYCPIRRKTFYSSESIRKYWEDRKFINI